MNAQPHLSLTTLPWLVVAALLLPVTVSAQSAKALEGTWDVTVTLRDCATGSPIRSFPRMVTFHQGGTLTERAAAGTEAAPTARTVGQGAWEHLGAQEFSYSLKFLRLTTFGGPDGSVDELWAIALDRSGQSYAADGIVHITLANGFVVGPLCATEDGAKLF